MKKALVASFGLFFAAQSVLATTYCTTKVDQIYIDQAGQVVVHGTAAGALPYAGWQSLCNVSKSDSGGLLLCSAWLAMAGQALGEQPTTFMLQTGYDSISDCSQIPASYPSPSSVMMFR